MTAEELGQALVELGFARSKVTSSQEGYVYRTGRVALAVSQSALERSFAPPHQDDTGAPWPVFLKLEARWLHAADIFRKNNLAADRLVFEQYLTCLAKMGLFPAAVDQFYEFDAPELLDLALSVNTQTLVDELTPQVIRARLEPIMDALVRVELYLVFGASLDALRHELQQRREQESLRVPSLLE
jgi:hypothetical protein